MKKNDIIKLLFRKTEMITGITHYICHNMYGIWQNAWVIACDLHSWRRLG